MEKKIQVENDYLVNTQLLNEFKNAFKLFDHDRDGKVTAQELQQLMHALGQELSKGEIINEPGNSNNIGTIAMAKVGGKPNSATSQWFINLVENKFLDSDNGGFTVFGHILGDGMKNPLLLNDQTIYNVNYSNVGLNTSKISPHDPNIFNTY